MINATERWETMVTALDGPEVVPVRVSKVRVVAAGDIDWSQVVFDLERAGLSQREIGEQCGYGDRSDRGKVSINQLKNIPGMQPRFHHGLLLLGLWLERAGGDVRTLPCAPGLMRVCLMPDKD